MAGLLAPLVRTDPVVRQSKETSCQDMTEEKSIEIKSVHRESEIGGRIKSRQDDDDDDGEIEYEIH